jgi:hypothetical protein
LNILLEILLNFLNCDGNFMTVFPWILWFLSGEWLWEDADGLTVKRWDC